MFGAFRLSFGARLDNNTSCIMDRLLVSKPLQLLCSFVFHFQHPASRRDECVPPSTSTVTKESLWDGVVVPEDSLRILLSSVSTLLPAK